MRSTAPFAVSAAPAETESNMSTAYTVRTYTEGSDPFVPNNGRPAITAALSAAD